MPRPSCWPAAKARAWAGRNRLLLFDGKPLIVHLARALERMFAEIVVVAAPDQELPDLPVTLVRDEVAYQGPVGGIYYGLRAASGKSCFVTSCDVAFLNPSLISHLLSQISELRRRGAASGRTGFNRCTRFTAPACCRCSRNSWSAASCGRSFSSIRFAPEKSMKRKSQTFDPDGLSFFNMNTPEDYQRLCSAGTS